MKNNPLLFPLLSTLCCTALLACDAAPPPALDDEASDTELAGDEEFDEDLDEDVGGSSGSSGGPEDEGLDGAADAFGDELDPSAAEWANWVGGSGGSARSRGCPGGHSVVGVAASSTGSFVRQLALVCGPDSAIQNASFIPSNQQFIIASGYYNNGFNGYNAALVAPNWTWRPAWDESDSVFAGPYRYKAPGTTYRLCNPGYRVSKVDVRAGGYVDRIDSITCEWAGAGGPPGGVVIYPATVNVGGSGGNSMSSSCQGLSGSADGASFRSAYWLDGFRLWCN
ncbi:MAG: hypothetical protein ACE37F_01960 [Nannocystaceae bacterium]|nr:hypothetical protein [bacterium]